MANTILVGTQWGDEGKGKIVDLLSEQADIVVRTQGGNNAGHTVQVRDRKFVLHLVPSGILHRGKICVIGNGVVVDPIGLLDEIRTLEELGIRIGRNLRISDAAHMVLPFHRILDVAREAARGKRKIGTTGRGIGPTYADKALRIGLRMGEMLDPERFRARFRARVQEANRILRLYKAPLCSFAKTFPEYEAAAERLRPHITNTVHFLHQALRRGKRLLFEGAQGTFLDIDHGTYPYVTSSNTTAGGACTGSGVPPNQIHRIIGVMKAYTTRVGSGPFPTENKELGDLLHSLGREFGATTGRPRRCGWFDAVLVRHAVRVNGITALAITNLDGLDTVERIKVCVAYKLDGKRIDYVPSDAETLARCEPVYREFPGWQTPITHVRDWDDLPPRCRRYLETLSRLVEAPLLIVSVGPERDQTIWVT